MIKQLGNGCPIQIHFYEPFIDDVADGCRICFAEDGSRLMERIESNDEFRESSWQHWESRDPRNEW